MKLIKNKTIYTGNSIIEDGYIRYDKHIIDVDEMKYFEPYEDDEIVEIEGETIIPGFIDIHSHGGYGYDCMDASAEEIDKMVSLMTAKEGITSYFCTTMTQTYENIESALKNINKAAMLNPVIQGVHLEGPFISPNYKGAQDPEFIKKPDKDMLAHFNELSGNRIRLVTYAPEEADREFEDWCIENHIRLSAGHTDATFEQLKRCPACHITHLYNAQKPLKHREPGAVGFAFSTRGVMAELICDGLHIMPKMIYVAWKQKGSKEIELITDSMRAKGMPEGESELGGQKVFVKNGKATLADGTIAGSILTYNKAFENIMKFTDASLFDAVQMTSVNQAKEFGLINKGELIKGKDADMVILDKNNKFLCTISLGKIYKNSINS